MKKSIRLFALFRVLESRDVPMSSYFVTNKLATAQQRSPIEPSLMKTLNNGQRRDEGICVRSLIAKISACINEVTRTRLRGTPLDRTAQRHDGISRGRNCSRTISKRILS